MARIPIGCIVDKDTFLVLMKRRLGFYYARAEVVFLRYKLKEALLSYSVVKLLLCACDTDQVEEVIFALEQAAPQVMEWKGSHKTSPNEKLIDDIFDRFKLG